MYFLMSSTRLFIKMFKYNHKKFFLFFICDSLIIGVLYIFFSLFFNETFMDPAIVDPYISYNIYAPSFLILLFSAFFIPYSHEVFNRQQRRDHAILLSIGSEEKIILTKVLMENMIIAILAIIVGVGSGLCFSFGIHYYIIQHLKIPNLDYGNIGRTCLFIITWFTLLYVISIVLQLLYNGRQTILKLIKDNQRIHMGSPGRKFLFFLGLGIIAATFFYMVTFFKQEDNNYLTVCYLTGALGIALVFFNSTIIISFIKRAHKRFYYRKIFILSDIQYRFQSSKKIMTFAVCILGLAIFFQAFPFAVHTIDKRDLNRYYPYDIAYASIYDGNTLGDKEINRIAQNEGVTIKAHNKIEYVSYNGMTILSFPEVNQILNKSYYIHQGEFMFIAQVIENDGRIHRSLKGPKIMNISLANRESVELKSSGAETDILVGNIRTLSEALILVNEGDFNIIKSQGKDCSVGKIHMINCRSLGESGNFAESLQRALYADNANKGEDDQDFYKMDTKYHTAIQIEQGYGFLLFLFTLMGVLLYATIIVMLHFKNMMNLEADRKMLHCLVKIGTTSDEISHIVKNNLYIMFVFPIIIAGLAAAFFGYSLFRLADVGGTYLLYSALTSISILAIQICICKLYNRFYLKKVFG